MYNMRKKNQIICNMCGKKVKYIEGLLKEDYCEIIKEWGYFSKKDMEVHKFNLCETCYDRLVEGFEVPIEIEEKSEAL
ncbi:MAG: hypothetical protein E7262_11345 [Lachnospiraceae bacterium]|nr:hypothetical protein [Lachnospiraceae bacterium]